MPKMERWIIASRMVQVLDRDTMGKILELGGQIGGGWCEVHQHVCVNQDNKERIEELLRNADYTVSYVSEHRILHPECEHSGLHRHRADMNM